ncbi:MAG: stage II sporulation protein R [Bacilli bacterium]
MKKIFTIILFVLFAFPSVLGLLASSDIIPDEAIRIRVIPNSNSKKDIKVKTEVKSFLEENIFDKITSAKDIYESRVIVQDNLDYIDENIQKIFKENSYNMNYDIHFGLNYFPQKEFSKVNYNEGYYESLVISIGKAQGDNWWCVLFPPICNMESTKKEESNYTFFFSELIDNLF